MSITSVKSGATGISLALDNNFMEPIATTLVGSGGVSQVTFNDIPQTYKHLQLRITSRLAASGTGGLPVLLQFNSDNSNNYSRHRVGGYGTGTEATGNADQSYILIGYSSQAGHTASVFAAGVVDILDYTNTNKYKTVRSLFGYDNNGSNFAYIHLCSGNWRGFDSVSSLNLYPSDGTSFVQYSRFSLYGIKG